MDHNWSLYDHLVCYMVIVCPAGHVQEQIVATHDITYFRVHITAYQWKYARETQENIYQNKNSHILEKTASNFIIIEYNYYQCIFRFSEYQTRNAMAPEQLLNIIKGPAKRTQQLDRKQIVFNLINNVRKCCSSILIHY